MYYFRLSEERGSANFGWLNSKHSFSFGSYYDPNHMGLSVLRVINDDIVKPRAGFDTHGHRDMEIISYVLEGSIEHKDSMNNHFVIPAGEVQRMTAGTGITHSEFNASQQEDLRFLQIWVQPNRNGLKPDYEQKKIKQNGKLTPLVTSDGKENSLIVHQDIGLYRLILSKGETFSFDISKRRGYLHIIEGNVVLNEHNALSDGDAVGAFQEEFNLIAGKNGVTALWFDLPNS